MEAPEGNGLVVAVSSAGVLFILLGLLAFGVPSSQEGATLWELNARHAISVMDLAGAFALILGLALIWVGSRIWNRQLLS